MDEKYRSYLSYSFHYLFYIKIFNSPYQFFNNYIFSKFINNSISSLYFVLFSSQSSQISDQKTLCQNPQSTGL